MKEIKIIIRIDEIKNKIGFIVDGGKQLIDTLELISSLELIKQSQLEKLTKTFSINIK